MDRLASFRNAEGRAGVLLDFDGTLSPIVAKPELARIRDGARDAIARLVGRYAVVAIVSGRTGDQLRELVGVDGVRLAALYGLAEQVMPLPDAVLASVREVASSVPGARVEPKGGSVAVHYRAADDAVAFTRLNDGESAFAALSWNGDPRAVPANADDAWQQVYETADFWRAWLNMGEFPDHPWRSHLQRAALTLKGLTYAPTGALIAAPTTSLPETPGGERNWDYRYSWVRDATFALWGLYTLGFDFEANSFFYFIADQVKDGSGLHVMYGVGGETDLPEETLDHLTGYEHARPVRIGNGAYEQNQHDVWGALLDSVYLHLRSGEFLTGRSWVGLERQVEEAAAHWREPDQGIWEMRGQPQHFVSSKIMCWVACDRGARLAEVLDKPELAARWATEADLIRADVLEHGVDERGVLTMRYGSDALDASLLLAPLMRFLPADDPRIRATVLAIADELTLDGLVLRYRVEEIDDGLEGEEATFAICSFWLVSALTEIGEVERARDLCERMLSFASPLGLYAEEIDPRTGRHWGNFPQAFTHLAQINALMHVVHADASTHGAPSVR
jgi:alpha,alpha-trehalase